MKQIHESGGTPSALHSQVWRWLQTLPGVVGLGIGPRGWRIYVSDILDGESPATIPAEILGFPAEVILKQPSFLCYGNSFQETLKPGIEIASKGEGAGSLGCFARVVGSPNTIVILSNSHVLYGDIIELAGSGAGKECGQPDVSCCCCCTSHVIGKNRGSGTNAFKFVRVKVNGFTDIEQGSEIDCGAAVLNNKRPYTNESEYYGMITGTPPAGGLGVSAGDAVEKVGSTTGHTTGKICQFNTVASYVAGGSGSISNLLYPFEVVGRAFDESFSGAKGNINQLFVMPDPDPSDPNRKTFFANSGDSGSAVVNSAKQVIGLVTRVWTMSPESIADLNKVLTSPVPAHAGNVGIVCPIGPVLKSLGIEIVNNMKGTATTAGPILEVPEDLTEEREKVLAMERKLQALKEEVGQRALGREVMNRVAKHRPEVARLIDHNRAVTVAWHRAQGPAFAAHCLHSFEDENYLIPSTVNGVTPVDLVKKMAQVLKANGSVELREDVEAHEIEVLDLISGYRSVWCFVDRIRKLNLPEYEDSQITVGSDD
jgi:hypothetical protein